MFNFNLPLRILQTLLSIITIALNGYVMTWWLNNTKPRSTPSQLPLLILTACWTLLLLPYFFLNPALSQTTTGKPPGRYFSKHLLLTLDLLTALLWFAAFVAFAVFEHKFVAYFGLTSPSKCGGHVCTSMIGAVVVAAVACVTFVASTVLAGVHVARTRKGAERGGEAQEHKGWVGMGEVGKV